MGQMNKRTFDMIGSFNEFKFVFRTNSFKRKNNKFDRDKPWLA